MCICKWCKYKYSKWNLYNIHVCQHEAPKSNVSKFCPPKKMPNLQQHYLSTPATP